MTDSKVEQELMERIQEKITGKFITDNTGERINGWLAFNVGQHAALIAKGDLREFVTIARPEHITQFFKEDLLPAIRFHVNASVGAAVEACAKACTGYVQVCNNKGCHAADAAAIRNLYPAATEELEKRLEAATEAALPLACRAIIESLDGGEFSPASPLAKVKAEMERRLAEARLEEHMKWCWDCNNGLKAQCPRRRELTAAAKVPSHD